MPLINVKLIEGVFDEADKTEVVTRLTDVVAAFASPPGRETKAVDREQFPAKQIPLRVTKSRKNKNVELVSDSTGSETALGAP